MTEKLGAHRVAICEIISEMLDNPGECEIYPTGRAYDRLEEYLHAAEAAAREEAIEECARWHDESTKLYENIAWQYGREGNDQGSAEMHQFRQEHQAAADHHRSLKEKEERSDDEAE